MNIRGFQGWIRAALLTAVGLIVASPVFTPALATDQQNEYEAVPGQYVVWLKNFRNSYNPGFLERKLDAKIIGQVRPDMIVIQRDGADDRSSTLRSIRSSSVARIVEPNYIFRAFRTPNDPDISRLWGMKNTGDVDSEGTRGLSGIDISAERAWDITSGSRDVVVAVVDTGVDFNHPELKNNMWINQAEKNGVAGVDDDGNGYVDDVHGYNFVANNGVPLDDNGHGTHCAGTIGAEGDNGNGIVGVAWNVSIMAVKFLDARGGGTLDNAIKAVDYARIMGAQISSNSWGGNVNSELLKKAIEDTREAGQIFVAAAGNSAADNDSRGSYPASFPIENIISVGAITNRGGLAYFSNYGATSVHVAAPGMNVYSTLNNGSYGTYSGTSMAAPHVSGVAALLLSHDPTMTYANVKTRLIESSRPLSGVKGKVVANGMVDAYHALSGEPPPADPNDPANWAGTRAETISTPHPYPNKFTQSYTVTVPGAKRVAVHFSKFETEKGYDKVRFLNGAGELLGIWSGNNTDRFSPIADGDTIIMNFSSDASQVGYGFDVDKVAFEQ